MRPTSRGPPIAGRSSKNCRRGRGRERSPVRVSSLIALIARRASTAGESSRSIARHGYRRLNADDRKVVTQNVMQIPGDAVGFLRGLGRPHWPSGRRGPVKLRRQCRHALTRSIEACGGGHELSVARGHEKDIRQVAYSLAPIALSTVGGGLETGAASARRRQQVVYASTRIAPMSGAGQGDYR